MHARTAAHTSAETAMTVGQLNPCHKQQTAATCATSIAGFRTYIAAFLAAWCDARRLAVVELAARPCNKEV